MNIRNTKRFLLVITLVWHSFIGICQANSDETPTLDRVEFKNSKFGVIHVLRNATEVKEVAILISGSQGLADRVVEIAEALANKALVIGIDGDAYRNGIEQSADKCAYLSGELVRLSQSVQSSLQLPSYIKPYLVGFGSGAPLAFMAYSANQKSFKGILSIHFCPSLIISKEFCEVESVSLRKIGDATYELLPGRPVKPFSWVNAFGEQDSSCQAKNVRNFVRDMGVGFLYELKGETSQYDAPSHWIPQAWGKLVNQSAVLSREQRDNIEGKEILVSPTPPEKKDLVLLVTGDGGWSYSEKELAQKYAENGFQVVGLDALEYFWTQKTPKETADYLSQLILRSLEQRNKDRLVLVGFQLGAEAIAMAFNNFELSIKQKIRSVTLISPSRETSLRAEIGEWIGAPDISRASRVKIAPQIPKMGGVRMICAYGKDDAGNSLCSQLSSAMYVIRTFPGGKYFNGDYAGVANVLIPLVSRK